MAALSHLVQPRSVTLRLTTQTPLYTGGIGQRGDQVHPSGIVGSIRHFSCLVARALGDAAFEEWMWGNAGTPDHQAAAKRVLLHIDCSGLKPCALPSMIQIPKEDRSQAPSRWYYNSAYFGTLVLTLTCRETAGWKEQEHHWWNLLMLSLRSQIRHGTFGAKDQFGLGVVSTSELPPATALPEDVPPSPVVCDYQLLRCAFGVLSLRPKPGPYQLVSQHDSLALGLRCRMLMRNALRADRITSNNEVTRWAALRHRMLGKLNKYGSAVNVSGAYGTEKNLNIRLIVHLRPDDKVDRQEIMKRFNAALKQFDDDRWTYHNVTWEFGGRHLSAPGAWINKLAGVTP